MVHSFLACTVSFLLTAFTVACTFLMTQSYMNITCPFIVRLELFFISSFSNNFWCLYLMHVTACHMECLSISIPKKCKELITNLHFESNFVAENRVLISRSGAASEQIMFFRSLDFLKWQ